MHRDALRHSEPQRAGANSFLVINRCVWTWVRRTLPWGQYITNDVWLFTWGVRSDDIWLTVSHRMSGQKCGTWAARCGDTNLWSQQAPGRQRLRIPSSKPAGGYTDILKPLRSYFRNRRKQEPVRSLIIQRNTMHRIATCAGQAMCTVIRLSDGEKILDAH